MGGKKIGTDKVWAMSVMSGRFQELLKFHIYTYKGVLLRN